MDNKLAVILSLSFAIAVFGAVLGFALPFIIFHGTITEDTGKIAVNVAAIGAMGSFSLAFGILSLLIV